MERKKYSWIWWREEWINPILIAVLLALFIRSFIAAPFKIPSTSMVPTLKIGDHIFVNKILYGPRIPFTHKHLPSLRDFKRGDIIVFVSVDDPEYPQPERDYKRLFGPVFINKKTHMPKWYTKRYIVKRLVGLPGETITISNGDIIVDGKALEEPLSIKKIRYTNTDAFEGPYGSEGALITVPRDHYFMLGDNTAASRDSRYWGFVPKGNIEGKVFVIWWPVWRIQLIR